MFTDMSIEKHNFEVLNAAASMFDQCQTKKTAPNTPHGQLFTCGKYDKLKRPINDSVLENPKARRYLLKSLAVMPVSLLNHSKLKMKRAF